MKTLKLTIHIESFSDPLDLQIEPNTSKQAVIEIIYDIINSTIQEYHQSSKLSPNIKSLTVVDQNTLEQVNDLESLPFASDSHISLIIGHSSATVLKMNHSHKETSQIKSEFQVGGSFNYDSKEFEEFYSKRDEELNTRLNPQRLKTLDIDTLPLIKQALQIEDSSIFQSISKNSRILEECISPLRKKKRSKTTITKEKIIDNYASCETDSYPKTGDMFTESLPHPEGVTLAPNQLSQDLFCTKLSFAYGYPLSMGDCISCTLIPKETWRIPLPNTLEEIFADMEQLKTGEMRVTNQEIIKSQQGIFTEVIKRFFSSIFSAGGITSMSLPVKVFEPRSTIDRLCDNFGTVTSYLKRANEAETPLERMKLLLTAGMVGLTLSPSLRKPFNPYLGETFEAEYEDGTKIYFEHIRHYPPQSLIYMVTTFGLTVSGSVLHIVEVGTNSINLWFKGAVNFVFENGDKVTVYYPLIINSGIIFGERLLKFSDKMCIIDEKYKLKGFVEIGKKIKKGKWANNTTDTLQGLIYVYDPKKSKPIEIQKKKVYNRFKESEAIEVLARAEGKITVGLEWDGVEYWSFHNFVASRQLPVKNPLPSDCRFREDILWMKYKNNPMSEKWKLKLEEIQRYYRKMRADEDKRVGRVRIQTQQ